MIELAMNANAADRRMGIAKDTKGTMGTAPEAPEAGAKARSIEAGARFGEARPRARRA
jgi:hypothetical protein